MDFTDGRISPDSDRMFHSDLNKNIMLTLRTWIQLFWGKKLIDLRRDSGSLKIILSFFFRRAQKEF